MSTLKSFFRRLYYVLLLMLLINFANAQTDINTSFSTRMNYIFEQLEKNRVPNGLLLDYAMEFTNLENYSGTTVVSITDLRIKNILAPSSKNRLPY